MYGFVFTLHGVGLHTRLKDGAGIKIVKSSRRSVRMRFRLPLIIYGQACSSTTLAVLQSSSDMSLLYVCRKPGPPLWRILIFSMQEQITRYEFPCR